MKSRERGGARATLSAPDLQDVGPRDRTEVLPVALLLHKMQGKGHGRVLVATPTGVAEECGIQGYLGDGYLPALHVEKAELFPSSPLERFKPFRGTLRSAPAKIHVVRMSSRVCRSHRICCVVSIMGFPSPSVYGEWFDTGIERARGQQPSGPLPGG